MHYFILCVWDITIGTGVISRDEFLGLAGLGRLSFGRLHDSDVALVRCHDQPSQAKIMSERGGREGGEETGNEG